ncbi:hypothetical protein DRO69_02145 [Candidatus Bathyarchaeota archaeon]|nr:MAG: hypothetical protein DRO69_02145 [Candidatus Bathyarchaeota archaeon]
MGVVHRVLGLLLGIGVVVTWANYYYFSGDIKTGLLAIWLTILFVCAVILSELEELKEKGEKR